MSDSQPKRNVEQDTVTLNLKPFTPGATPSAPQTPSEAVDDSVTMLVERASCEVAAKGGKEGHPVVAPANSLPPKEMLGVVSYSYAKGVYRSEDIARKLENDPEFRAAAGENLPDAKSIRRFRRLNREAILETLSKVFRRQRKKSATELMAQTLPGSSPVAANKPDSAQAADAPGETTIVSKRDAEAKLNNAAWIDNMSRED